MNLLTDEFDMHLTRYQRSRFMRDYPAALVELDEAITLAPHPTCLPVLMQWRDELQALMPRKNAFAQWVNKTLGVNRHS